MSTDFSLVCPSCERMYREPERIQEGGTQAIGGVHEAELNVTYNYAPLGLNRALLEGKTGAMTVAPLRKLVEDYGTERGPDYWEPTEGNVGFAASILLRWAERHPEGVWRAV